MWGMMGDLTGWAANASTYMHQNDSLRFFNALWQSQFWWNNQAAQVSSRKEQQQASSGS
jgi:hypothetical protein